MLECSESIANFDKREVPYLGVQGYSSKVSLCICIALALSSTETYLNWGNPEKQMLLKFLDMQVASTEHLV